MDENHINIQIGLVCVNMSQSLPLIFFWWPPHNSCHTLVKPQKSFYMFTRNVKEKKGSIIFLWCFRSTCNKNTFPLLAPVQLRFIPQPAGPLVSLKYIKYSAIQKTNRTYVTLCRFRKPDSSAERGRALGFCLCWLCSGRLKELSLFQPRDESERRRSRVKFTRRQSGFFISGSWVRPCVKSV